MAHDALSRRNPSMPSMPETPPSPPSPVPVPASPHPSPPAMPAAPAAQPPAAEPAPLMPYDHLIGSEAPPPEPPPSLTFNVAAAPPAAPTPTERERAAEAVDLPAAGIVVSDDRPAYAPPLPPHEPEPLLHSPAQAAPPPAAFVPAPGPPPARPTTIAELFDKVDESLRPAEPPPPPAMWQASAVQSGKPPAVHLSATMPTPPPTPRAAPPAPVPAPPPAPRPIAPAPVRTPPPSPATASRPMPLSDDDESDYVRPSAYDDGDDTLVMSQMPGHPPSTAPDADTVIAVAAPMRRAHSGQPSVRLLGMLCIVLLALWIARLGAAPLFDVDEGAFSEATRELVTGHDWGSTTLNGVDRFDKPILIYWLQAISVRTFGVTEFAVRLPSALAAFLWCLALAQFAWRRFGPPVAIAAAGILATSLMPMLIGRAATADSLLNLLLTLSTLDVWRHLENGKDAPRRRAFAWIGLGLLAKGPVAFLIPAAAAALWLLVGRDRSRLVRLVGDAKAWASMAIIAAPWYAYALWRHGMAFVDGFLLHHNLDRFTGSMEGHAGSLFYYVELLPAEMMPWTPLLVPILWHLRARWREPLGRFLLLWLGFVLVFFSISGTKLPHYILYGFTPLMLLAAQELVTVKRGVRAALFVTIAATVALGAASPWIARYAAARTHEALYATLLASAPGAPWVWLAVPIVALVFALTIWVPNVRHYLSEAEGALLAALLGAGWLTFAVIPWWAQTLQEPIRTLARTLPIAQLNLQDHQRLVQWKLHQPSIAFYLGQTVERAEPVGGDWAFTRVDRLTPVDLARMEVVQQVRGYALVRPASAASEPLARLGAARTAAVAASQAALAEVIARTAARVASEAQQAASVAAANAAAATTAAVPPAKGNASRRPTPP